MNGHSQQPEAAAAHRCIADGVHPSKWMGGQPIAFATHAQLEYDIVTLCSAHRRLPPGAPATRPPRASLGRARNSPVAVGASLPGLVAALGMRVFAHGRWTWMPSARRSPLRVGVCVHALPRLSATCRPGDQRFAAPGRTAAFISSSDRASRVRGVSCRSEAELGDDACRDVRRIRSVLA